jgi:hypothetical protein
LGSSVSIQGAQYGPDTPQIADKRQLEVLVGLAVSLIVIAVGAILVWGVNADSTDFNVDAVGVILMVVGLAGFLLSLVLWRSWWGPGAWASRRTYVEGGGDPNLDRSRRVTHVEREEVGPPAGPPP